MIYKDEVISIDGVTTFTAATIASAKTDRKEQGLSGSIKWVECGVTTAAVRIRRDGGDPTSSIGQLMQIGDFFVVSAEDVSSFKAIKAGASAGKIVASYVV